MPISYFIRRFSKSQRNYSVSERELYAIVLSIEYFRQFLYGRHFNIITDHKPLQYLLTAKELSSKLMRLNRLNQYEYTIIYRKGKHNTVADALTRIPMESINNENDESNDDEPPIIINYINVLEQENMNSSTTFTNLIIENTNDLDDSKNPRRFNLVTHNENTSTTR
jgi:hypothetical protein